MYDISAYAYS
jgi:hypothetical protein